MGKRPRKVYDMGAPVKQDALAFDKNKSSPNARKVHTQIESIEIDIWFDKHYYIREQHGDDAGKREGIDSDIVKKLIQDAAKHLLFYSLRVKGFSFVNFESSLRPLRIVLSQVYDGEDNLNITAEYHYLKVNQYEVTIQTALRKNDFTISDGQYQIMIDQDGTSTLFKNELRQLKTISQFES